MTYRARAGQRSQDVGLPCPPTTPPPKNIKFGFSTATIADTKSLRALNSNKRRRHLLQRAVPKPSGAQSTVQQNTSHAAYEAQRNGQEGANASVATRGTEPSPTPTVPEVDLKGFSFMTSTRLNGAPQSESMFLLVNNGPFDHYFDDTIIPGLETHILNVEVLENSAEDVHGRQPRIVGHEDGYSTRHCRRQGRQAAPREEPRRYRFRYGAPPLFVEEYSREINVYYDRLQPSASATGQTCLLYTSDAADE